MCPLKGICKRVLGVWDVGVLGCRVLSREWGNGLLGLL